MKNKKKPLELRPVERNRLANARWLAEHVGGIAAFSRRLARPEGDTMMQNYIGKTPNKRIGNKIGPDIESAFGLENGELDRDWNGAGPPSWPARSKEVAAPATLRETSSEVGALSWIIERMISHMLQVKRPDEAAHLFELLDQLPEGYRTSKLGISLREAMEAVRADVLRHRKHRGG